jgi:hypothetical protein
LDNLLSEMLLTVEALPDITAATTANKQISDAYTRSQASPATNTSPPRTFVQQQAQALQQQTSASRNYSYAEQFAQRNDIGETSSITTTLTPTESGRNTPALSDHPQMRGYYNNNDELYYDTDTQMQLHGKTSNRQQQQQQHPYSDNDTRKEYQKRSENLLQNQSFGYMEVLRSENNISGGRLRFEEEQSNVPYHAREYSKPFSYLPSKADGKIIRMHSGLSSPSMVRKALNLNNGSSAPAVRKQPSQDFAERNKYTSKYTFGDKTPDSSSVAFDNEKLFDYRNRGENVKTTTTTTTYSIENSDAESSAHYFEPLRRSNTMDGSFGRSGYASDG